MLNGVWTSSQGLNVFKIIMLSPNSRDVLDAVQQEMMQFLSEDLQASFDKTGNHPFKLDMVQTATSIQDLHARFPDGQLGKVRTLWLPCRNSAYNLHRL